MSTLDSQEPTPNTTSSVNASTASTEIVNDKGETILISNDVLLDLGLKDNAIGIIERIAEDKDLKTKDSCQNCKFWRATSTRLVNSVLIPLVGDCKIRAPSVIESEHGGHVTAFPSLTAFDWCGEFVAKPDSGDVDPPIIIPATP